MAFLPSWASRRTTFTACISVVLLFDGFYASFATLASFRISSTAFQLVQNPSSGILLVTYEGFFLIFCTGILLVIFAGILQKTLIGFLVSILKSNLEPPPCLQPKTSVTTTARVVTWHITSIIKCVSEAAPGFSLRQLAALFLVIVISSSAKVV